LPSRGDVDSANDPVIVVEYENRYSTGALLGGAIMDEQRFIRRIKQIGQDFAVRIGRHIERTIVAITADNDRVPPTDLGQKDGLLLTGKRPDIEPAGMRARRKRR
jgi:hypothetical protein